MENGEGKLVKQVVAATTCLTSFPSHFPRAAFLDDLDLSGHLHRLDRQHRAVVVFVSLMPRRGSIDVDISFMELERPKMFEFIKEMSTSMTGVKVVKETKTDDGAMLDGRGDGRKREDDRTGQDRQGRRRVEDGEGKLVKQIVAATVLLWAATAHAQPENATGAIMAQGRRFALRYAYASVQSGFFDKKSEDIRVLLTDVPVDEKVRGDVFALSRLADSGKLQGLEVVVDEKGQPMSGFLFLDAFDSMVSAAGMHKFERKALERTLIAGRMFTQGPSTFSGITWEYDVTFSAEIVRPPTKEEIAAALKSPPALAAAAHLDAIQTGFEAFVATLTNASAVSFRAPGGQARYNEIRAETPVASRIVMLAKGPNDTHIATVQSTRRDGVVLEDFLKLRQEGTAWKVER